MRQPILGKGGFTELSMYGCWRFDAKAYVRDVRRYAEEIGRLEWAAPMDWMTEPAVLTRTGSSLRTHQRRTVENFLELRTLAPDLPFIPVLQGQTIRDYHRCADLYETCGIDLAAQPLVGVGSVCRRQASAEIETVLRSLFERVPRLHAFGVKTLGLRRFADTIVSSDSAAWSLRGRYVRGCSPSHRHESNCLRFALEWRAKLINSEHHDVICRSTPRAESRRRDSPTLDSTRTCEANLFRFSRMGSSSRPVRRATVRLTGRGKCSSAFTTDFDATHLTGLNDERKGSHSKEPVA